MLPCTIAGESLAHSVQTLLRERQDDIVGVLTDRSNAAEQRKLSRQLDRLRRVLHASLVEPDAFGLSKLHSAVIEHRPDRIRRLLAAGLDRETTAGDVAVRPLHLSVLLGDEKHECLETLLEVGNAEMTRALLSHYQLALVNAFYDDALFRTPGV